MVMWKLCVDEIRQKRLVERHHSSMAIHVWQNYNLNKIYFSLSIDLFSFDYFSGETMFGDKMSGGVGPSSHRRRTDTKNVLRKSD